MWNGRKCALNIVITYTTQDIAGLCQKRQLNQSHKGHKITYQNQRQNRPHFETNRSVDVWALQETVKTQVRMIAHLSRSNDTLKAFVDLLREFPKTNKIECTE